MVRGQIIAVGGGGFSAGSEPGLDQYVLEQCQSSKPGIGFLATATGDSDSSLLKFYTRFASLNCRPSHLPLFHRTPKVVDWIQEQDVIYVGGGNTKSMLAVWEAWELPGLMKQAAENGTILAGVSAGAICWFNSGVTDSNESILAPLDCLGFIEGSCCPHYRMDPERKPTYEHLVGTGKISDGIAIDDGAAVHFIDGKARWVVSGCTGASSYEVCLSSGSILTRPIASADVIDVAS